MFVLDHIPILIAVMLLMFVAFTWLAIYERVRHLITSIVFTFLFFESLIKIPVFVANAEFRNKQKRIKQIMRNESMTEDQKMKQTKIYDSKLSLFISLYTSGALSYQKLFLLYLDFVSKRKVKVNISITFGQNLANSRNSFKSQMYESLHH